MNKNVRSSLWTAVGFGIGMRLSLRKRERSIDLPIDLQFTGAYPRGSGAFHEGIGGHPEDMNGMPADPLGDGPIFDGRDLSRPA